MRKIILSMHITLDGFVGGPNGEMDCFKVDAEMFDLVGTLTNDADTALYGRKTYEMMEGYWPTAADGPNATKHDVEHSAWYNRSQKVVVSATLKGAVKSGTIIISENVVAEVEKLKNKPGKNILIFGSPSVAHVLMEHNLIDEYWLFVNPIIIGKGIPLFAQVKDRINLQLITTKVFGCGVTGLHYRVVR